MQMTLGPSWSAIRAKDMRLTADPVMICTGALGFV